MRKTFVYHKPTESTQSKITEVRKAFDVLADVIDAAIPTWSREKSVALTKLEEAIMWAIKALVCNDPESVVVTY